MNFLLVILEMQNEFFCGFGRKESDRSREDNCDDETELTLKRLEKELLLLAQTLKS